jgi:cell shape-determining protein MreD
VSLLRFIVALATALALQAGLSQVWPDAHRYIQFMLVPVVWYGVTGSQRSGMLAGCASGLLHDAWFQIGAFGLTGFKWTLLGWALGGVSARFDLNRQGGRMISGIITSLVDSLMDPGLRRLLDQRQEFPGPTEILIKAVGTGLLVAAAFSMAERVSRRRRLRRLA